MDVSAVIAWVALLMAVVLISAFVCIATIIPDSCPAPKANKISERVQ
jgi:hypothetical protein